MRHDDTDNNKKYFRTDERVVRCNQQWFFLAREGQLGPYASEIEARRELALHVEGCQALGRFQAKRESKKASRDSYGRGAEPFVLEIVSH